ncbi:MAG: hypothetical protein ISR65_02055 [Bacteriovoracaceae bacterium]|nr:hypothetical protein [Bacteriovoracaceae bacterium]
MPVAQLNNPLVETEVIRGIGGKVVAVEAEGGLTAGGVKGAGVAKGAGAGAAKAAGAGAKGAVGTTKMAVAKVAAGSGLSITGVWSAMLIGALATVGLAVGAVAIHSYFKSHKEKSSIRAHSWNNKK